MLEDNLKGKINMSLRTMENGPCILAITDFVSIFQEGQKDIQVTLD